MKIVIAYNKHRHGGGSDVVAQATIDLLASLPDVEVVPFIRDSRELAGLSGKIRALIAGCYSREAIKSFARMLDAEKPDLVHAHEIYPLISPWIFKVCKGQGIPVVMTCHDYRMSCPIVTHFRDEALCHECPEHNEWRCVQHNCSGSMAKSIAYAARNALGRKKRLFLDHVDLFLTPSEKAKEILCAHAGLPEDRVVAVGNPVPRVCDGHETAADRGWCYCTGNEAKRSGKHDKSQKKEITDNHELITDNCQPEAGYVAYAGRFEPEKGFDLLVESLAGSELKLKVAGDASAFLLNHGTIPDNIEFVGHLDRNEMNQFYENARLVVVPSLWHETFGLVVAEALECGTPVIVSDLGALAEVAGPGGLVVPAGDVTALRDAISKLWSDKVLCRQMGKAGRDHVKRYSNQAYVDHLMAAYEKVLEGTVK